MANQVLDNELTEVKNPIEEYCKMACYTYKSYSGQLRFLKKCYEHLNGSNDNEIIEALDKTRKLFKMHE